MTDTDTHSDYLDAREALCDLMCLTRVPNLTTMETISALADAIIDAGWKSPQQIEQTKYEVWEQGGAAGENYGFQSHSRYGLTRPKNPYRKNTK